MSSPDRPAIRPGRGQIVRPRRLPISEFAFSLAGAASPFGDDLRFPLPVERLTYTHPEPDAEPAQGSTSDPSHR
jgi:hypothetical protein